MAGYIKGITIEFGADTTKLNNALKKTQGAVNKTQTELKQINRALKFNPGNTTLLQQKFDLLKKSVTQTEDKLQQLKNMQKQMQAKGIDENSAAYRELQREIIKTENKLESAKGELKEFGSVGKQQAKAVGDAFKSAGQKISDVGQNMTTSVTLPLIAGFTASAKYASDFEENLNKIDVAFGKSGDAVKKWAETAGKQFGLSQVQATDAASGFGALAKGIGLSDSEAATMAMSLAGLSADLGSYFNMSNDESAKALEGIFTGESEALKRFGVVMTDTNMKKFAEDQGLVWDSMTESEKATLRYQYVLAKTKDAQGDYSRTSDGTANSIKTFQASVQDLATIIGQTLLPIITPIIQKITEWIKKYNELSPTAQKIITVVGLIVAAIGPVLVIVGAVISAIGAIIPVVTAVAGAFSFLIGPVGIVVAAIAAAVAIGVLLYKNWDTISKFASKTWGKIKASVVKVATTIKTTVLKNFNTLKSGVTKVWNAVKNAITKPMQKAKSTVFKVIDAIKKKFDKLKKLGGRILSGIKLPKIRVKGGKAPFGIGGKGSLPSFSVKWNAQAMDNPYMFRGATLFGAGEAGDEILYGRHSLMNDITQAMNASNSQMISALMTALRTIDTNGGGGEYTINLVLGGSKVATGIYKLGQKGQMILEG